MGKVTRKHHGTDVKAKGILEAITEEQPVAELAAKDNIHSTMITALARRL